MNNPNRFAPPSAEIADVGLTQRPGSWVLALIAGFATDMIGTTVVVMLWGAAYAAVLVSMGSSPDSVMAMVQQADLSSPFGAMATLLGSAMSVAGGFVCSRIARRLEYRLGAVLWVLLILTSMIMRPPTGWTLTDVGLTFTTLACVLLGSHLGRVRASMSAP